MHDSCVSDSPVIAFSQSSDVECDEHFVEWGDKRVRVSYEQRLAWDTMWDYLEEQGATL